MAQVLQRARPDTSGAARDLGADHARTARGRHTVGRAVAVFAVSALVAVVLVGVIESFVFRSAGTAESIRDARTVSATVGHGIVEPALTDGIVAGDPRSIAEIDGVVRDRVLGDAILRVKIWDATGRIVYSDEPRLIGARYTLGADEQEAIQGNGVDAELSDLGRPENRFERRFGQLLEVYLPVHTPNGTPLLFETYLPYRDVAETGRKVSSAVIPALVIGLVVLALIQIPLAWRMARRIERGRVDRERLLRRALEASTAERRRIAGDLHDGVVQEFAGLSMSLSAAAEAAESEGAPGAASALRSGADRTRHGMRQLRTLLVEIYPPSLHTAGLEPALSDLLAPLLARGVATNLEVDPGIEADRGTEALVFRTAQEALRNVQAHSDAGAVEVRLRQQAQHGPGDALVLTVRDDGRGFSSEDLDRSGGEGHMGLPLLAGLAEETGGRLSVESEPGLGTIVRLEVPVP